MFHIYQNYQGEGYGFNTFKKRMIHICNEHKQENRALAFAFILYDFKNPHLSKILHDKEYWIALNEITGEYLTVFSLSYQSKIRRRQRSHSNFQDVRMRVPILSNTNLTDDSNALVEKYFGDNVKIKYPAILFFQVDNDSIIDSLLINLKEEEIEKSYLEIKEYFAKAVSTLELIAPENRNNNIEIFNCLEKEVKSARTIRNVRRVTGDMGGILGLISSIKGILS